MTIKQVLDLLDTKNHNMPALKTGSLYKDCEMVYAPIVEGEEKNIKRIFTFLKNEKISGKKGEKKQIVNNNQIFNFTGIGKPKMSNSRNMRRFFGQAYLSAFSSDQKKIALFCPREWVKEACIGIRVSALDPAMFKSKPKQKKVPSVILFNPEFKKISIDIKKTIKAGEAIADGKNIMRVLGAIPPNVLHTDFYAKLILELAKKWKVPCKRLSKKELAKYNLLNAVSQGSRHGSEMLVLTLHPNGKKTKESTVVVGKGLCFDSGGLQGKQQYMKFMREDMAGSASCIGTIYALLKGAFSLRQTIHFILPLAENMMGGDAMRPDDVYTAGDGQKVEIIHTDAEGRLAIADAICYAKNSFKDAKIFYTIATLTGSCVIALGEVYSGVVCNDEEMALATEKSGKMCGDHCHTAPWDMEYDDNNSPVADIANLGEKDRDAGWIKAGLFLYKFIPKAKKESEQVKFCHIDIAGSIDMQEKGQTWRKKGFSSGVGVSLLVDILAG